VPGKRLVLVDGYNVIKNDPVLHALERHSLAVARDGLLTRLMTRFDHETNDITVVFDGPAEDLPVPRSQRRGGVTIIPSGNPSRHDDDEGSPHRKKKGNPHRRKKGRRQQPPIHW